MYLVHCTSNSILLYNNFILQIKRNHVLYEHTHHAKCKSSVIITVKYDLSRRGASNLKNKKNFI